MEREPGHRNLSPQAASSGFLPSLSRHARLAGKCLIIALPLLLVTLLSATATALLADDKTLRLKAGAGENYPKIFTDASGKTSGLFPDVLNYIAGKEGWEIEYVPGTWTQCLERLERGEIDILPDIVYTPERAAKYDFSRESVYLSWSVVYSSETADIQSVVDLEGKRLAVMTGSVNVDGPDGIKELTASFDVDCAFLYVESYAEVFELLDKNEADAGVVGKDFAYINEGDYDVTRTGIIFQPVGIHFAFPRGADLSPYLIERIDFHVKSLKADGNSVYYQLLKHWFNIRPIEKMTFPDWAKWLLAGVAALALLLGSVNLYLGYRVKKRTAELAEDIARRETAEAGLRESEGKLNLVFETVPYALVVYDLEGRITKMNDAAYKLGGFRRGEVTGRTYGDFYAKKDRPRARDSLKKILGTGSGDSSLYTLLKEDGKEFPARVHTAVITNNQGDRVGFLAVIEDLTMQKQVAEERRKVIEYRQMEKLRTDLLSTVSHELRTPLACIKGYATMLLKYYDTLKKEQQSRSLEAIEESTDRLTELTDHLLDMSRLDVGLLRLFLEPVKPRDILLKAIEEAGLRAPDHGFTARIKRRLPALQADARRLREVVDNLLNNAIKYSAAGTEITLRAEVEEKNLLVSVADQGIGIPKNELDKIFDRFYRLDEKLKNDPTGLGLGLSLCKALVEAHGGAIWAESEVGRGSTFYFTVPLKRVIEKQLVLTGTPGG